MNFLQRRKVFRLVSATDLIPVKRFGEEETENGTLNILYPRFKNIYISRLFDPGQNKLHIRIRLDAAGSAVWKMIDGSRNSGQIISTLATDRQDLFRDHEAATEQILKFLSMLYQQRYISFRQIMKQ